MQLGSQYLRNYGVLHSKEQWGKYCGILIHVRVFNVHVAEISTPNYARVYDVADSEER
jgi:hypothetical protein